MNPHTSHVCTLNDPRRLEAVINKFTETKATENKDPKQIKEKRHKSETLCRKLLEAMLAVRLPKSRPKWLVNPVTKRPLELDMYNHEKKIAFEYDGAQHNVFTPHYHGNQEHFEYRKSLDKLKMQLCHNAGVRLVRISYKDISLQNIPETVQKLQNILSNNRIQFRRIQINSSPSRDQRETSGLSSQYPCASDCI